MRHFALLAAALPLNACTSVHLPADTSARLDPIAFFTGRTEGRGELHQIFAGARAMRVESSGRPTGGGGLVLTQRISQEGKAPRTRVWTIRPVAPGRYSGSLTEAVGPVALTVAGPRAQIRYRMKGGLDVHQQLALQPDGRTVLNHLEVAKLGVRVAHVEETIRKLP
ncbi:DUF3833 domain-containing protein [Sphingomonas sp. BN140010]|uniref:DUF3833 domain-containing protein n=1 Tax=Sphingomonas arvum TaxID=2992113 RepID=A0ABT3JC23_9SPHN|nr:DUF3833 domain-containing protein [Sphingomonas sp. BN140010]MCW3796614.1 DUF3833 domain-containing protein [Sphingomonas sp. BN140010]